MRILTFAPLLAAVAATFAFGIRPAAADPATRVSGPHVHENLAIYFVHGASSGGPIPLTLQEALAKGSVQVAETGRVNELEIENSGADEVFIQAGDMVKGGRQDRVLTVSFLLPPKSGKVPIASFCVEQGRWAARGKEDSFRFSSAHEAMPSRAALLAMATPAKPDAGPGVSGGNSEPRTAEPQRRVEVGRQARPADETVVKQRKVWDQVAKTQRDLSSGLSAQVAAPESSTSLQLTLEHDKLKEARTAYVQSLEAQGLKDADVVGYIVAINGRMASADVYPSNGLFRKMWSKQLAAVVTEAIGEKREAKPVELPKPAAEAGEFLANAERGASQQRATAAGALVETRDADGALYNEARKADGRWLHRSYLAK